MPVPFVIICRNRLSLLQNALNFSKRAPHQVYPVVADMGSNYPPLVRFLHQIKNHEKVLFLDNIGPRNLWSHIDFISTVGSNPFFLSDGDIDYSHTDPDVFSKLTEVSNKYPGFRKIGSALKIDDLDVELLKSKKIIENEKSNWNPKREIENEIYLAPVDTVFAYYRKRSTKLYFWPALRVAGKFTVRHAPWYEAEGRRTEEEEFYALNAKWWGINGVTSGEKVRLEDETKPEETKVFRYSKCIKFFLKYTPNFSSRFLSKLINISNPKSFVIPSQL
jgi:hypothetical protein